MSRNIYFFELTTDPALNLMENPTIDALYEAGCDDALVGHSKLSFARRADTWEEALESAKNDAESVAGVRIISVRIESGDITPEPASRSATILARA